MANVTKAELENKVKSINDNYFGYPALVLVPSSNLNIHFDLFLNNKTNNRSNLIAGGSMYLVDNVLTGLEKGMELSNAMTMASTKGYAIDTYFNSCFREKYNETPTANTEKSIACKKIQDKVLNSKVMTARASKVTLTNKYQGFEISYIFNLRGQANKTPLPCIVFDVEISIVNCHNLTVGSSSKLTGCVMMLSNIDSEQVLAEQMVLSADKILAGKMYSGVMEKDIRKILRVDRDIAIEVGDGLVSETTKTYQIRFGHIS